MGKEVGSGEYPNEDTESIIDPNKPEFAMQWVDIVAKIERFLGRQNFSIERRDDFLQEVFLRIFPYLPKNSGDVSRLGYKIALNLLRDIWRNDQIKLRVEDFSIDVHQVEFAVSVPRDLPEDNLDMLVESELLMKALDGLPLRQRQVILLKVVEGMSHREIAEVLNIRDHTSKRELKRAIIKLKEFYLALNQDF